MARKRPVYDAAPARRRGTITRVGAAAIFRAKSTPRKPLRARCRKWCGDTCDPLSTWATSSSSSTCILREASACPAQRAPRSGSNPASNDRSTTAANALLCHRLGLAGSFSRIQRVQNTNLALQVGSDPIASDRIQRITKRAWDGRSTQPSSRISRGKSAFHCARGLCASCDSSKER
jgi:hypothetical protein